MSIDFDKWQFVLIAVIVLDFLFIIFNPLDKESPVTNSINILGVGIIISLTILLIMTIIV